MQISILTKISQFSKIGMKIEFVRLIFALFFLLAVFTYSYFSSHDLPNNIFLTIAALFGAYMAMNIGANDVANNVGPAVGSKALSMLGAIIIAAIFESLGALIAGGDVVNTIKKGIIDINAFSDVRSFIWAMMAALLASALWLNIATFFKAPVSTTHSIVGGVMGAGIASFGFSIVSWATMGKIAISWIISPVLGGVIAAVFLYLIEKTIISKEDKIQAAIKWVPFFISIMSWAFITYITLKGLKKIWPSIVNILSFLPHESKPSLFIASSLGLIVAFVVFFMTKKIVLKTSQKLKNNRASINMFFMLPLVFAAALLSFAHGANDVANAVGPLAAINDAVINDSISTSANIPLWVMGVGALGIALGLSLYGPKLIKTVGNEITDLDEVRAFSVAISAAITVIIASAFGLPVSSTHIAIGGIFGVGFLREYLEEIDVEYLQNEKALLQERKKQIKQHAKELKILEKKENKIKEDYKEIVNLYKKIDDEVAQIRNEKKQLKSAKKTTYVKRGALKKIIAAWIITVPIAAILSAMIYFMIRGMVL